MGQNIFTALTQALSNAGVTGTSATNVLASVAGTMVGSVSSQVNQDLNQLMALVNNPAALAASGPAIITKIETINGLPTTVLPLLENLRKATDPLQIAQLIAAVESTVNAQSSFL
jgi:hypothetical protein